jgi:hypothetical protein
MASTFLRKLFGINAETEHVPPTTSGRTTTYNFESMYSNEDKFRLCVTFIPSDDIRKVLEECMLFAIKEYYKTNNIDSAIGILPEDIEMNYSTNRP